MAASKRPSRTRSPDPRQQLKQDGPKPVYAVDGVAVLVNEFVDAVRITVFPPGAPGEDFNVDTFTGRETSLLRVLDAANMLPAFAPRRLVLVRRANLLLEGRISDDESKALLKYLEAPSPTTTLVLIAESKWDGRSKVYKALKKAGALVRFDAPSEREMPKILGARAEALDRSLEPEAIRVLVTHTGADLQKAVEALEYLDLYVGPGNGRPIKAADVESVFAAVREESVFELVDAISEDKPDKALRGLYQVLVAKREPALRLLALIARHYRLLLRTRSAQDSGQDHNLASLLGVPPFVADRLARQAHGGSLDRYARALASISVTDRALKGGALDDHRAVERLVLALQRDVPLEPIETRIARGRGLG